MRSLLGLVLLVLFIPVNSQAAQGTCSMYYESHELGKLSYQSLKDRVIEGIDLSTCVSRAKNKLGKFVKRKTLVFNDERLITDVFFEFSDRDIEFEGHVKRP